MKEILSAVEEPPLVPYASVYAAFDVAPAPADCFSVQTVPPWTLQYRTPLRMNERFLGHDAQMLCKSTGTVTETTSLHIRQSLQHQ